MKPSTKKLAAQTALNVRCPRCGSMPKEQCKNGKGVAVAIHIGRFREAKVGVRLYSLKEARKSQA
jgi:uncharacterized Zn finger protein